MKQKNRVFTPDEVESALLNLPPKYVGNVKEILTSWKEAGLIEQVYCQNYIVNVKNGRGGAFNSEIMQALIYVGLENLEIKKQFGRHIKKAPKSN